MQDRLPISPQPHPSTQAGPKPLSHAKDELLAKFLRGEIQAELPSVRAISRRHPDVPPQLSLSQERLWFLDQLNPGSPVFNVPISIRLSRAIDAAVLQRSINEIVWRHEILRTTFREIDGRPVPVVSARVNIPLEIADLTSVEERTREHEARRLAQAENMRPFDLAHGPLIRTRLIKLSPTDSVFLLTLHHIVSDGSSLLIFFRELTTIYRAFSKGETSPLPELPIQYGDYAAWQRESLGGEVEHQLAYWKRNLAGELPILEFPTDRPRPTVQTHAGDRVALTLPATLTRSLLALSQRAGSTLFITLAAALKILLHRYTGQEDIIIGSPIANRPQRETEQLIGFFLNNLALRTDLGGDPTFRELLARVRTTALDAYSNQDVPFEKLIEELKPPRDLSRTSIFQVYFNLFSFSDRIDSPDGSSISFVDAWLQSDETLAKFDLTLYAGVGESEIKLALVYNTNLFDRARMIEMLAQLETLLSQIVEWPDEKISSLTLVTGGARQCLPDPAQPFDESRSENILSIFSEQVRRRPHEIAVSDPSQSWTYRQLDLQSNQVANYLLANGIEKENVVAIYAHRSAPLVAAVLGILKAGAAFTILDPAFPEARLCDCLQIASPRGFIQIEAAGSLPAALEEFVNSLDPVCHFQISSGARADSDWMRASSDNPNLEPGADDLAYIAFTSGSTGQPKAVMGRHGPLTLFTFWAAEKFGLNDSDRFCVLSGLAHDPLHRDIFTPLQLGGSVCIPEPKDLETPARLRAWMHDQKITVANLTPAMGQLLTEDLRDEQIHSLRYSFLVGDALTRRHVARLQQLAPAIRCINLYGSTETQRAVGFYQADAAPVDPRDAMAALSMSAKKEALPLGKGIRDVQLLVLDRRRQLCGVGELGEVYLRSPHLARGYLGDEQLTRERFIVNPLTRSPRDRLYRTGDLGRYLPGGNVEHVGRADRQVKIRGFRIELAEIETALAEHSQVREAAVIARLDPAGEKRLVAYVVGNASESVSLSSRALRDFLSVRLPAYMAPAAFVFLDALPLTPNGKLDRGALPAPDQHSRPSSNDASAPRSVTEQALIELWQEILGCGTINVDDNFFELGGHSLLAVRLFARIEKRFGRRLPLATLFQSSTVKQLAAALDQNSSSSSSSLVAIQPSGTRRPFFCVHAVGGNVLEYYDLARHLGPDQPFYGLQSFGLVAPNQTHARIEDMAAHYVKEIREVQPSGPYFIGGRSLGGIIAYETARQLRGAGQDVALLALFDSYPVGHQKLSARDARGRKARRRRRLAVHFANLQGLSMPAKLQYLLNKSQYAPRKIRNAAWRAVYRSCEKFGIAMPRALSSVEQFNWLAAHRFVPRLYDGPVTLFWASTDLRATFDQIAGWQKLAPGGLEVREVPGSHLDMIKEPHVAELAKQLEQSLLRSTG